MNRHFFAGIFACLCLLFIGTLFIYNQNKGYSSPEPQQNIQESLKPSFNSKNLNNELSLISNNFQNLDTAISVLSVTDSSSANINGYVSFEAASVNKVPVAIYALHKIDKNELNLSSNINGQSLQQLLESMIIESDNYSWETLISYFGLQNLKAYMQSLNIQTFYSQDENYISPQDSAILLKTAYSGLLGKDSQLFLKDLMQQSTTGPIELSPEFSNIAKKAGWLQDRYHLVGVIEKNGKTVSFAIFTQAKNQQEFDYKYAKDFTSKILSAISSSLNDF